MTSTPSARVEPVEARPGIAERLAELIRIPTVYLEREQRGSAFADFEELLAHLYPLTHRHLAKERIADHGLVFAWQPDQQNPAPPVVLMGHYDVVPVAGQEQEWTVPPFEGRIQDGQVWGRGTLDDKGAVCVLLEAVENLLAAGWSPQREVLICLGGDEEVSGRIGQAIAETFHGRGVQPWFVLDEGGAVADIPFPGVPGPLAMVGLAEKGVMVVEVSATSEGGHASAPSDLTAVGRVSRAVARMNHNPFTPHLPATVAAMFEAFAGLAEPKYAKVYRAAARMPWVTARLLLRFSKDGAAMVRTTLAPTMMSGGSSPNVLPSQAGAVLNLRVNVGETTAGALARLRRVIDDRLVSLTVRESGEPTPESSTETEAFALISEAIAAAYPQAPTVPYLTMAATDGRHWHRFTPNVYRFAPLAMDDAQRYSVHGVDERVDVDSLIRGEQFYRALLTSLPAKEKP